MGSTKTALQSGRWMVDRRCDGCGRKGARGAREKILLLNLCWEVTTFALGKEWFNHARPEKNLFI